MILYVHDAVSNEAVFILKDDTVFDLGSYTAVFDVRKGEWFIRNQLAFPTCLQKGSQVFEYPDLERAVYFLRVPDTDG